MFYLYDLSTQKNNTIFRKSYRVADFVWVIVLLQMKSSLRTLEVYAPLTTLNAAQAADKDTVTAIVNCRVPMECKTEFITLLASLLHTFGECAGVCGASVFIGEDEKFCDISIV